MTYTQAKAGKDKIMSILSELSRLTGKEGDSIVDVLGDVTDLGMSEADVDAKLASHYVTAGATDKTKVGQYATAEGYPVSKEVGYGAHAEGATTQVLGAFSHGEGFGAVDTASAQGAHAEGSGYASAQSAHAEGNHTMAKGENSHAEGDSTTASGANSHAEGDSTTASGANSHASGYDTIATADSQFVCGKYNKRDDNAIFIVGIGNVDGSTVERENIFSVGMYNGVKKLNFGDVSITEDQLKKLLALITS